MDGTAPVILFISDLHLSQADPSALDRFLAFMQGPARQADALYVLGDLFEVWVGDDDLADPIHQTVVRTLADSASRGTPVFIMHGNRDFLIGPDFTAATGAERIPDPFRLDLFGTPTLLMHGDSLCLDDQAYQDFRAKVRQPDWQATFLAKPLAERKAIALALREDSRNAQTEKSDGILDVNTAAVADCFRQTGCLRLIHGHTHRPAQHRMTVDGLERERWVLPDWYSSGGYLRCDSQGCRLMPLSP